MVKEEGGIRSGGRVVAVIPARGGSKRLPGKNLRAMAGKPLIGWVIASARASRYVDDVIVSTDDRRIARVAKRLGARVPFLRPAALATDRARSVDVVIHALRELERSGGGMPGIVIMLQATSPNTLPADIDAALAILMKNRRAQAVVSVVEVGESPFKTKVIGPGGFIAPFLRKRHTPALYRANGALYACRTESIFAEKTLFPPRTAAYIMPKERSADIDDIVDFVFAETLLKNRKRLFSPGRRD